MEQSKLVEQMLTEKGNTNNSIDLDAYASGLIDMYEKLVKNNIVLPAVSGCTCNLEQTDVYDDGRKYLGHICSGCGYFCKY